MKHSTAGNRILRRLMSCVVATGLLAPAGAPDGLCAQPGIGSQKVSAAQAQADPAASYDSFMQLPVTTRRRAFEDATPEQRCELMRVHLARALRAVGPTLSPDQRQLIGDLRDAIKPDWYKERRSPDSPPEEAAPLLKKANAIFTREQRAELLTLQGRRFPEK